MPALGRYVVLRNCLILLKVTSLVLKSIFLLQTKEIDWLYEGGVDAVIFRDGMFFCSSIYIHCRMYFGWDYLFYKLLCLNHLFIF
ncbi:hypothetical protein RND81_01G188400 [Saponaria officinalis]|uniref:Uncharacterized protein n=1 Tax=Saponaria officinalis TaxID=3572 RepID=A0AAW1N8M6_SAPOF